MGVVVPDAIEPYIGWKALRVTPDGRLSSPQQPRVWAPGQRLKAECAAMLSHWGWVPIDGPPRPLDNTTETPHGTPITITASSAAVTIATSANWQPATPPPKPSNPLPPGWNWSWEPHTHDAPNENCHCGIYAVDNPAHAASYLNENCVLARVALWGKTVLAHMGARGQYAYPQTLHPKNKKEHRRYQKTARLYNIPCVMTRHVVGSWHDFL